MRYWKKGIDGAPLTIDRAAAFDFIEQGVYGAEAPYETSRTLVQRIEAVSVLCFSLRCLETPY